MSEFLNHAGPAAVPTHRPLGSHLLEISCEVDALIRKASGAIAADKRVYDTCEAIHAQQQACRVVFSLIQAREAIAAYRKLAGE